MFGTNKTFLLSFIRKHFKLFTINKLTITFTLEDDNRGNCSSFMVSDSLSFSTSPLFVYFLSYICSARRYRYKLVLFVSWKKRGKVVGLKNFLRFFYRSQIYHLAVLVKNVPLQNYEKCGKAFQKNYQFNYHYKNCLIDRVCPICLTRPVFKPESGFKSHAKIHKV
jgi:hypothetical protein